MKNRTHNLACPACGHKYAWLYFRVRSKCPFCSSNIETDLRFVSLVESLIGTPVLWLFATWLRIYLHDEEGVFSYILLTPITFLFHLIVVNYFVKARVIE